MRSLILLFLALLCVPQSTMAWGKKGHDVICYIAERHLTPNVLARVTELLDGRSMVYYANWMDSASHTREYAETKEWHYFNVDRRESIATQKRSKKGDLLTAVEGLVVALKDGKLSREQEVEALKMLIHLVGDMHQPMHLGHEDDEGGNNIPVVYFVESTSLHALWDYHLIEGVHVWSYTEWQEQIDRGLVDAEVVVSGSYQEWLEATHQITKEIYRDTPAETRVFYEYSDKYAPIVEQQLLYAGLRLAHILNGVYD